MDNAFEELNLNPGLRMDLESLRERYDVLCREKHPDQGGSAAEFERLQKSFEILRDPVLRIRHWLSLHGKKPGVVQDPGMMGLFGEVGGLMTRGEEALTKKAEAKSNLARSLAEKEIISLLSRIEGQLEVLSVEREQLLAEIFSCESEGEGALDGLVGLAGRLVFLDKWERQLRECWVRLGL